MIQPGKFLIVEMAGPEIHLVQGFGMPNVGDVITVADRPDTRWSNSWGNWCWAESEDKKYGANFHESQIERIEW